MNKNTTPTIGEVIRSFRLKKGLKQHELATALGTEQSNISRYEKGERGIPVHIARRLVLMDRSFSLEQLLP